MKGLPDPTDTHVGKRVRMRRLMLGMSQMDLANAVGVTFQQIQKYEKGKNRISASCLQQMSSVLQVGRYEIVTKRPEIEHLHRTSQGVMHPELPERCDRCRLLQRR